jgi:hypothetical protein
MRGIAGLLLAAMVGCGGADAMPLPARPAAAAPTGEVGLNPGETMTFEVRLGGILAGEAQLAVGELGNANGHREIVVKSRAATAGAAALIKHVIDEATTVIDLDTGRPLQLDTFVEMADKHVTTSATFTGTKAEVTYTRSEDAQPHKVVMDFGVVVVHDAHSAMALLRGWRPPIDTTRTVNVIGGRKLWRVDVRFAGTETIGSALGNRRAVRFEGKSYRVRGDFSLESKTATRTFTVWLSDDADRVPLKVVAATELGDIVMSLTEYFRP